MTIGVGLLTYNHASTGRTEDFWRTWFSLREEQADQFALVTNGSTDGTERVVERLGGIVDNGDSRIWYGNTRLIEELRDNDWIVLSADDLEYLPGWLSRLRSFLAEVPDELGLISCYMEPVWDWNRPSEKVTYGGEDALIRASVCGSSWVFRSRDWYDWMGPFEHVMPGEDLKICERIAQRGLRMAALDLCDHIGQDRSAWGNQSHLYARPINLDEWGMSRGDLQLSRD